MYIFFSFLKITQISTFILVVAPMTLCSSARAEGRRDSIKKILNLRSSLFVQLLLWGRTGGEGNKKVPKSEAANRMR